jgi:hypothetical protein
MTTASPCVWVAQNLCVKRAALEAFRLVRREDKGPGDRIFIGKLCFCGQ